jgi:hypothetical protein
MGLELSAFAQEAMLKPEQFGAKADGVHDDTQAIQKAIDLANGKAAVLLTGTSYRVNGKTSGILQIPSTGLRLRGAGPQGSTIQSATDGSYILLGNNVSNLDVSGLAFEGTNGKTVAIVVAGNSTGIKLQSITTRGCGLFYCNTAAASYATTNDGNSPSNIDISGCVGHGNSSSVVGLPFINLNYASDVRISNCHAEYYRHGIAWWGGDSAYNADGALTNIRKTRNILISNCGFKNIDQGGIWGSMGRNIKVVGCSVDTCGDVGFDAEGCQEVTFSGGKVKNCTNGCLTTFWGARNILFENVAVEMSKPFVQAFRSYNATLQSTFAESVRIVGGSMTHLDGTGLVTQGNGPLDNFVMEGTSLRDVVVDMTQPNIHNVLIEGVNSSLTRPAPMGTASAAICIGNLKQNGRGAARGTVRNCKVSTTVPQPGLSDRAIGLVGGDANAITDFSADSNTTSGFGTGVIVSDNAGRSVYRIRRNRFNGGQIDDRGVSRSSVEVSP